MSKGYNRTREPYRIFRHLTPQEARAFFDGLRLASMSDAMAMLALAGYCEELPYQGESGDHGYGSRRYFRRDGQRPPSAHRWMRVEDYYTATVSRVGRFYYVIIFDV